VNANLPLGKVKEWLFSFPLYQMHLID